MLYGALIGSPLLFIRDDACVESNRSREVRRSLALAFVHGAMRVKNIRDG
jgi:hypothetical protein